MQILHHGLHVIMHQHIMTKHITLVGQDVCYEETGPDSGMPVILMHGWGCTAQTVRSIAADLDDRLKVYSIDLPGHGQSAEPPAEWGVYEYASLVEAFILALGLERPSLIGHSYGGRVAIVVASRNAVHKTVLVDSAGIKPKRSLRYHMKVTWFKIMKKAVMALYGSEKGKAKVEEMRSRRGSADYRNSSPVMRAVMSRSVNQDLRHLLPSVKCPTLLVWGEDDTATPMADARIMERAIPDAGLVSFAGCGHYSFLDNPYGFKRVIREFFKPELSAADNQ